MQFIKQMENEAIHQGLATMSIQSLLRDCATCPLEPGTDVRRLGPIASKLLELATRIRSDENKFPGPELAGKVKVTDDGAILTLELYDLVRTSWTQEPYYYLSIESTSHFIVTDELRQLKLG
jgi:hypothetical protein